MASNEEKLYLKVVLLKEIYSSVGEELLM